MVEIHYKKVLTNKNMANFKKGTLSRKCKSNKLEQSETAGAKIKSNTIMAQSEEHTANHIPLIQSSV